MSAAPAEPPEVPESPVSGNPHASGKSKGRALPVVRTPKQAAAEAARALGAAQAEAAQTAQTEAQAAAARVAQIANLLIAGHTLSRIAASTGHSVTELERMLATDTARYVRTQPALRMFVRNYLSAKYTELLDAVWDQATDKTHEDLFDAQNAAVKILDRMGRLHGAEAPTQTEVKVEHAPEAVEKLVERLAASQGRAFDASIFDVVEGEAQEVAEAVHGAVAGSLRDLERASEAVEEFQPGDPEEGL